MQPCPVTTVKAFVVAGMQQAGVQLVTLTTSSQGKLTLRAPHLLFSSHITLKRVRVLSRCRRFCVIFPLNHHLANPKTCSYVIIRLDNKTLRPLDVRPEEDALAIADIMRR